MSSRTYLDVGRVWLDVGVIPNSITTVNAVASAMVRHQDYNVALSV